MVNDEVKKPEWLVDFKRRIALIEIIDRCFEIDCNCEICQKLREFSREMGKYFELPEVPTMKKE